MQRHKWIWLGLWAILVAGSFFLEGCGVETDPHETPRDAAFLEITPGPIFQFPATQVGSERTQSFTVLNRGGKPATQISGDFPLSMTFRYEGGFPGLAGNCSSELAVSATCTIEVTFSPQSPGDNEQVLHLGYHDGYSVRSTPFPVIRGRGL